MLLGYQSFQRIAATATAFLADPPTSLQPVSCCRKLSGGVYTRPQSKSMALVVS